MHQIMRPDSHLAHPFRNFDAALAAGEGLLVVMRMGEHARSVDRAVRPEDFPAVGIMRPARIRMAYRDIERKGARSFERGFDVNHIGLARNGGDTSQQCQDGEGTTTHWALPC